MLEACWTKLNGSLINSFWCQYSGGGGKRTHFMGTGFAASSGNDDSCDMVRYTGGSPPSGSHALAHLHGGASFHPLPFTCYATPDTRYATPDLGLTVHLQFLDSQELGTSLKILLDIVSGALELGMKCY
jgi:hypothetical protein